jgi:hypothetical protein
MIIVYHTSEYMSIIFQDEIDDMSKNKLNLHEKALPYLPKWRLQAHRTPVQRQKWWRSRRPRTEIHAERGQP